MRVIEGGAKVGTTLWIFAARNQCQPEEYKGWVILNRSPAKEYEGFPKPGPVYMAYHPDKQMGLSAMTGDEIGPCPTLADTKASIDAVTHNQPTAAERSALRAARHKAAKRKEKSHE